MKIRHFVVLLIRAPKRQVAAGSPWVVLHDLLLAVAFHFRQIPLFAKTRITVTPESGGRPPGPQGAHVVPTHHQNEEIRSQHEKIHENVDRPAGRQFLGGVPVRVVVLATSAVDRNAGRPPRTEMGGRGSRNTCAGPGARLRGSLGHPGKRVHDAGESGAKFGAPGQLSSTPIRRLIDPACLSSSRPRWSSR